MTVIDSRSDNGRLTGTIHEIPKHNGNRDGVALEAQMEGVYNPKTDAWLSSIYVDPEASRQCEGGMLIDEFIRQCKEATPKVRAIVGEFAHDTMREGGLDAALEFYASREFTLYVSDRDPDLVYVIKYL